MPKTTKSAKTSAKTTTKRAVTKRAVTKTEGHLLYGGRAKTLIALPGIRDPQESGSPYTLASLAASSPWAYRAISLKADALAQIPWAILDASDKQLTAADPAVQMFTASRFEMGVVDLLKALSADLDIYGRAYLLKLYPEQTEAGEPRAIRRLNPSTVTVQASAAGIAGFQQTFEKGQANGQDFARAQVAYFRTYNPTDDLGYTSPTDIAANAIRIESAADEYLRSFFANHAVPDVWLTTDAMLLDADYERILRAYNRAFRGSSKAHKTGIGEQGLKLQILSFPLSELALEEVRLEARRQICAAYAVPMSIVGADASANYATADIERKSLYTETVIPRALSIAAVITRELLADFGQGLRFVFLTDELPVMGPAQDTETARLISLFDKGLLKAEALGKRLGLSPEEMPSDAGNPSTLDPNTSVSERPELAMTGELKAMKRWAVRRFKAAKPLTGFETKWIDPVKASAIQGLLDKASTLADIDAVFGAA